MAKSPSATPSIVDAVQAVYSALQGLDANERAKVLASASALLGMQAAAAPPVDPTNVNRIPATPLRQPPSETRPKSLVELMQEKNPKSNTQMIALFAYYRDKYENRARFARGDLKDYFSAAKEKPGANYDRDFTKAVRAGWIHEAEADSYLTSRGLEAVESGFATSGSAPRRKQKKTPRRPK